MNVNVIRPIADNLQVPEEGLRLVLSLLACYVLGLFYRTHWLPKTYQKPEQSQLFFIATGLLFAYFNFGFDLLHSFCAILITYLFLNHLPRSQLFNWVLYVGHFTHLSIGYWQHQSTKYLINWTMPQCVLFLRLVAVVVELSKPHRRKEHLDFVPFVSFALFPTTFLIGPQVSYDHFCTFVQHRYFVLDKNFNRSYWSESVKKLLLGLFYLAVNFAGSMLVSNEFIASESFTDYAFWKKMLLLGLWGRVTLYKYIGCWLLAEASCIVFGLAFSPDDGQFRKCQNVDVAQFENTRVFNHYIKSFNMLTNQWAFTYVYIPMKTRTTPVIAQLATLLFLIYWHGFSSGYLVCFLMEFLIIFFEKSLKKQFANRIEFENSRLDVIFYVCQRLYTFVFMGYCLVPFVFLTFDRYWPILKTVYFIGFIVFFPWIQVFQLFFACK